MLIKSMDWERIRHQFTESDRVLMNAAITGHTVCPRGMTIDTASLPAELAGRLRNALEVKEGQSK